MVINPSSFIHPATEAPTELSQGSCHSGAPPGALTVLSRPRSLTCISRVRWPMEISFARHQFPPDIIRHAVWLCLRFTVSFRDVEDLLAERGLDVSYETVRRWVTRGRGRCGRGREDLVLPGGGLPRNHACKPAICLKSSDDGQQSM